MTEPTIFITRRLPIEPGPIVGSGIRLEYRERDEPAGPEELVRRAGRADGVVAFLSDPIDRSFLARCPRLRVVANFAVGFDNVDVAAATERGIWVTNTPDVLTEATADLTWALLLAVARRLREGERLVRAGRFDGWSPSMLLGMELHGRTLGVFGFGRIGRAVARRAKGFGMGILCCSRSAVPEGVRSELEVEQVSKDELLARSDILTIHAPLSELTHHALGAAELARMKRHAILINTARGPLVDEAALVEALEHGQLGGAGLDVYEHEPEVHPGLLERDDVVLLPHLGSATRQTRRRMAEIALENAAAVLRGQGARTPVNRPC